MSTSRENIILSSAHCGRDVPSRENIIPFLTALDRESWGAIEEHTMSPQPLLPTVPFGPHQVTRLIVGGNPFRGNSHFSPELDREMRDYHTVENVVATLLRAQQCGINTMQSRGDEIIFEIVRAFRDAGGAMHWFVQTASEMPDLFVNIRDIAALDPIGIYWHGSMTDRMWKKGRIDKAKDYLKAIRDTGKLVGIASHMPEVLRYIEAEGWDVDFYMVCLYNLSKIDRQSAIVTGKHVQEPFDDADRDLACDFIRATAKPCIAYKALAASRKCTSEADIRAALAFAYERIKPGDIIDIGVFQKHSDQVSTDARIARDILGA